MPGIETSKFGQLAEKFELYERRADAILHHLGRLKPLHTPAQLATMMWVQKHSAAGIISSPHDFASMQNLEDIPLGMQVRKRVQRDGNATGGTLECPGGAYLTDQELEQIKADGKKPETASGGLFYQKLFEMLTVGDNQRTPQFTYDNAAKRMSKILYNVRLEIKQEMGIAAAKLVRLVRQINSAPKWTDLTTVSFGNENNQRLVDMHGKEFGLELIDNKKKPGETQVSGFVTRVTEDAMWADVDDVREVANEAVPTEEADGMYVYTIGELMSLFEYATKGNSIEEQAVSWDKFAARYPQLMRPRSPSTAWQIRMLLEYMGRQVQSRNSITETQPRIRNRFANTLAAVHS